MKDPTRLYLKNISNHCYSKCAWFHNNKLNEMLIGFYGLNSNEASLKFLSPEKVVSEDELSTLTFTYPNFVSVNEKIDHITCHEDGTFHIKTKKSTPLYRDKVKRTEALGVNTSVFLEMMIITDLTKKYSVTIPKYPHVWVDSNENDLFILECVFSGANYPLENYMSGRLPTLKRHFGHIVPFLSLRSSTIRGIICPLLQTVNPELLKERPDGTIILFKFPITNNRYRIKGFVFA